MAATASASQMVIEGGGGNDHLEGGADGDTFVFRDNWGADFISDFENDIDLLDLTAVTDGASGDITYADLTIIQDGNDTLISYGSDSIRLINIQRSNIDENDFNI